MNKGEYSSPLHETSDFADSEIKPLLSHESDERSGIRLPKFGRDIHVARQTRSAPDLDGLSAEQVPPVRPCWQDSRQGLEELSESGLGHS